MTNKVFSNKLRPPIGFTGTWVYRSEDGTRSERAYVDGIAHGRYCQFHRSGVVAREGVMDRGLENGLVIVRASDAQVLATYEFRNGTGVHLIFTCQKTLGWEVPYQDGKMHGTRKQYANGKLIFEDQWLFGKHVDAKSKRSD